MGENPYIRIIKAAKSGKGVLLTNREVRFLAQDSAIVEVSTLTGRDRKRVEGGSFWITKEGFEVKPEED